MSNNIKEIKFDSSSGIFSYIYYDVLFMIVVNIFKNIRIGVIVGGVFNRGE